MNSNTNQTNHTNNTNNTNQSAKSFENLHKGAHQPTRFQRDSSRMRSAEDQMQSYLKQKVDTNELNNTKSLPSVGMQQSLSGPNCNFFGGSFMPNPNGNVGGLQAIQPHLHSMQMHSQQFQQGHPSYPTYVGQQDSYFNNFNYVNPSDHSFSGNNFDSTSTTEDLPLYKRNSLYHPGDIQQNSTGLQDSKRARHTYEMAGSFSGFPPAHPYGNDYGGFAEQQMMLMMQHNGIYQNHRFQPEGVVGLDQTSKSSKLAKKKRQTGDMPRRPLTAYNFFFSEEREFILAQLPDKIENDKKYIEAISSNPNDEKKDNCKDGLEEDKANNDPIENIMTSMRSLDEVETEELHKKVRENTERMLTIHKESERVKKPHKRVHGKIAFRHLAKIVGKRWRDLPDGKKKYYEDIAAKDSARYSEQLTEYNKTNKE